jgi:hypothetical protein
MIEEQYKQNAADAIKDIHAQPSQSELQTMREMILLEMYKDIASLPAQQQAIMKQQINIGFVAQNRVTKTGMTWKAL